MHFFGRVYSGSKLHSTTLPLTESQELHPQLPAPPGNSHRLRAASCWRIRVICFSLQSPHLLRPPAQPGKRNAEKLVGVSPFGKHKIHHFPGQSCRRSCLVTPSFPHCWHMEQHAPARLFKPWSRGNKPLLQPPQNSRVMNLLPGALLEQEPESSNKPTNHQQHSQALATPPAAHPEEGFPA